MGEITSIGIGECVGCKEEARLVDGACPACRERWGSGCGRIMTKVRTEPGFALLCFRHLDSDAQRDKFIEMFGDPREAVPDGSVTGGLPGPDRVAVGDVGGPVRTRDDGGDDPVGPRGRPVVVPFRR